MIWALIVAWQVAVFSLFLWDPHPSIDKRRCYLDRVEVVRYCWPKSGCFWTDDGVATCWQVGKLSGRRGGSTEEP